MKRLRSLLILTAATLSLSSAANAAVLSYTLAGSGNFTGTLAGTPFIGTSFSVSGSADSSTIQTGVFPGSTAAQAVQIAVLDMVINTTTGPLSFTLLPRPGNTLWHANTYTFGGGASIYEFGSIVPFNSPSSAIGFAVIPADSIDLATPATYYGDIYVDSTTPFDTTGGALVLNMNSVPSSFNISAVPEPATATSSLLLSLAGLSLISRRNRKA